MIRRPGDEDYRWAGGTPTINTFSIRHSSNVVTQVPNESAPYEMTVRLWFADRASLMALRGAQGGIATLRYNADMTDDIGGTIEVRPHGRYLALPDTVLVSVTDVSTRRGQPPEATATFRRSVADASYYGYAVYSEG